MNGVNGDGFNNAFSKDGGKGKKGGKYGNGNGNGKHDKGASSGKKGEGRGNGGHRERDREEGGYIDKDKAKNNLHMPTWWLGVFFTPKVKIKTLGRFFTKRKTHGRFLAQKKTHRCFLERTLPRGVSQGVS